MSVLLRTVSAVCTHDRDYMHITGLNDAPHVEIVGGGHHAPPLDIQKGAIDDVEDLPAGGDGTAHEGGSQKSVLQAKLTKLAIQIGYGGAGDTHA
jgi:hypothetical protein